MRRLYMGYGYILLDLLELELIPVLKRHGLTNVKTKNDLVCYSC
jgi:hypothetical protein